SPIPKQRVTKAEIEQARTPAGGLDQKAVGSVGRAMAAAQGLEAPPRACLLGCLLNPSSPGFEPRRAIFWTKNPFKIRQRFECVVRGEGKNSPKNRAAKNGAEVKIQVGFAFLGVPVRVPGISLAYQ